MRPLSSIFDSIQAGDRLDESEALRLFQEADLQDLGLTATMMRNRHNAADRVSYVVDRNVNYTDICSIACTFCAFHHHPNDGEGYVLSRQELESKARETQALGGTGFLLQGGVNPELPWSYYLELVHYLHTDLGLWVHGFSPIEIRMMAQISGQTLEETLLALKKAGLGSLPGGGAEILVDRVRNEIAPLKGSAAQWLEVMDAAHAIGLPTTGTMMFGITETFQDRVLHLKALRDQQDRALAKKTGGHYTAFAAWPFQSGHTAWEGRIPRATDVDYLRTISIARIYLDNFQHIQSSWVTMGRKTGQVALHYGCDDMGSLMIEENVVSSAGTAYRVNRDEVEHMIQQAGFTPWQRSAVYAPVSQKA